MFDPNYSKNRVVVLTGFAAGGGGDEFDACGDIIFFICPKR